MKMSEMGVLHQSSVQVSYSTLSFFPRLLFVSLPIVPTSAVEQYGNQSGTKGHLPAGEIR